MKTVIVGILAAGWMWSSVVAEEEQPAGAGQAHLATPNNSKAYRLPGTKLVERVQWGGWCKSPAGEGLLFGGEDQAADDGNPHTQVWQNSGWVSIYQDLRARNPLQKLRDQAWALRVRQKNAAARARFIYFQGLPASDEAKACRADLTPLLVNLSKDLDGLVAALKAKEVKDYEAGQAAFALSFIEQAAGIAQSLVKTADSSVSADAIKQMAAVQVLLEKAAEALDAEPPPRTLSPIVYDAKSKLFIIFGGDHCDYLTNDTWAFDPAEKKWMQRHPKSAPPPRANHLLKSSGDGTLTLSDGYTYANSTGYMTGQYKDLADGPWKYDVAADAWSGPEGQPGVEPTERTYHTGAFHPDFFLQGEKPNAAENEARLKALPANAWVDMKPPQRPMLNRDWGTAVLDPDHDLILRWSGGHCAHGGTDVPHYHLATNRWELAAPVEMMLGFLYDGTEYPIGYNFNQRPWMPGHTYRSYAYDTHARRLVYVGAYKATPAYKDINVYYLYDPEVGDWVGRGIKPAKMSQGCCVHVLIPCDTPKGLFCWNQDGELFRFEAEKKTWAEVKLSGARLPGTSVDSSSMVYDAKRDRLLCLSAKYMGKFDGEVYAIDLRTFEVKALAPAGKAGVTKAMTVKHYLREADYDIDNDLLLVGSPLAKESGLMPAYDCTANRWVTVKLAGLEPVARDYISLGLSYDPKRKLHWAIGQWSDVHALRLDAKAAPVTPLEGE